VHSFRIVTVILAWVFIAAAFYEKPELLTGLQRAIQRGMEVIGDSRHGARESNSSSERSAASSGSRLP
jgi:hypothetical protein